MNIKTYLNNLKDQIDRSLDRYLPSEKEYPKAIHWAMRYSVFSGGKRIRPILAIESARVCKGVLEAVLPVACAIELVHTYSLIHDDLPAMDDDDYRRGRLTSHKVFGEANAILAGDALLALAFNIIAGKADPKIGLEVTRELSEAIGTKGMVGGQVVDLEFSARSPKVGRSDKKTLDYINRFKTARLFEASTKMGAIAARAGRKEQVAMAKFGSHLGIAFQITDDIIDKEGYARIFGLDRARRESKRLIEKAKGFLNIFGTRSKALKEIADYILARTR